jgi:glycosyltransferase involved in cell wall biosynthesis
MSARTVYFHVGRFGHPFFREQLHSVPEGFAYRTAPDSDARAPRRIALQGARLQRLRGAAERVAIRSLSHGGYVRRVAVEPVPGCALIHSAQQLLRDPSIPYVLDFECVEAFCLYQRVALRRGWARRHLLAALTDERCRFVAPWSQAARRSLESALGPEAAELLRAKTGTVLPAIRPRSDRPAARQPGPLRVLFVGTAFEAKGGVEALRALQSARAGGHELTLDVVSNVPARWHTDASRTPGVTIHPWPTPGSRLRELFEGAEVLLFPSHMDTLGFVILEAMAHGMPVLATRHFAVPELVEDGVSGIVVEAENPLYGPDGLCRFERTLPPPRAFRRALTEPSQAHVERLAEALVRLAEEPGLHERLAAGALTRVRDGPLSVDRRREALGRVYRAALAG